MSQQITVSVEEQAHRRKIMHDALVQIRLEGLEPDPIIFDYIERYVRGDISLAAAIADYAASLTTTAQVS